MTEIPGETNLSNSDLAQLLSDLNSADADIHQSAMEHARALPPDDLLCLARHEAHNYRHRNRRINLIYLCFALLVILFASARYLFGIGPKLDTFFRIYFLIYGPLILIQNGARRYIPTRARRSLAEIIEDVQDLRFLSTILNLIREGTADTFVQKSARTAFKRLVPQLLDPHQRVISSKEHNRVLRMLLSSPYSDVELTLSVLKVLEQVGDESAIPVVKELATEPPATPNMKRVRQAARECLPYLHEHIQEARQAQTLLRPSDSAASGMEALLRPTTQAGLETPQEQLLRVADPSGTHTSQELSNSQIDPKERAISQQVESGD